MMLTINFDDACCSRSLLLSSVKEQRGEIGAPSSAIAVKIQENVILAWQKSAIYNDLQGTSIIIIAWPRLYTSRGHSYVN